MCTVTLQQRGKNTPEVVVELCVKSQLLGGGKVCPAAKAKREEYKGKYKETVHQAKK